MPARRGGGEDKREMRIKPSDHLHGRGSVPFAHKVCASCLFGSRGWWARGCCACSLRSIRELSFLGGPGHVWENTQGSFPGFSFLSFAVKGMSSTVIESSTLSRTDRMAVKRAAWGRNLCLWRESRGLCRLRLGTKMDSGLGGHEAVACRPEVAAFAAVHMQSVSASKPEEWGSWPI